jgi:HAD superfamily phosphatase (TIGR01668 family)
MKHWGRLLQPDLVLGDSILGLTPELIHQHQLKGLILDVDETLVPFNQPQPMLEVQHWAQNVQTITTLVLVSNNLNHPRIRRIADALDLPYFTGAGKPSRRKLRKAMQLMNLPAHQIAMVGDRLFTDVLAGNRLGMFTVLVEPMSAVDNPKLCIRNCEIWISTRLGVTLHALP